MNYEQQLKDEINAKKQILIIDLRNYLPYFTPEHVQAIEPPDPGVYIPGELEPTLRVDRRYYFRSDFPKLIPIKDFKELQVRDEDVLNSSGRTVIRGVNLQHHRRLFTPTPAPEIQHMKIGIAVVLQYLNQLCSYTNVNSNQYNLGRLLKTAYRDLAYNNTFQGYFHILLRAVEDFVAGDTWHVYTFNIRGTKLFIQKELDVRIQMWYDEKIAASKEN